MAVSNPTLGTGPNPIPVPPLPPLPGTSASAAASGAPAVTGNPVTDLYNLIQKLGQKFLDDLTAAQAYASAKDSNGNVADPLACPCLAALIPLAQLIINGPPVAQGQTAPSASQQGVVTELEKLRIINNAINSQSLKTACAPLVQDEIQNIQNFAQGLLTLLQGATLTGAVSLSAL